MSNSYVTCKTIAERALPHLIEKIQMLGLVQNGAYNEAVSHKTGDTIQIRKPQRGSVVDGSGDISGSIQDIKDETVELTLNHQDTYPVAMTSKEQALNIDDMERQVIVPAVTKLAEKINERLLGLYVDVPFYYGASGTTPDALSDIAQSRKVLQNNNAPRNDRAFVFDPDAEAEFLELDSLVEVDKSGTTSALRDAVIGRVYDVMMVSDTMVPTHTAGTFCAVAAPKTDGSTAAGATTITMDGGSGAETILKGDIFTIAGTQYVATANATASSGEVDVPVYPAVPAIIANDTAVVFPDKTAGGHVANLMFQKDAFAIAFANLPAQPGADTAVISYNGFSIRVTSDYDINNDKAIYRFDVLYGLTTTYPELCVRVLG
jgi:hypothetical protein